MKAIKILPIVFLLLTFQSFGQRVENFSLEDILNGEMFELNNHNDSRAIVLVFTTLSCPFSKLYENRIIDLYNNYSKDNFVFAMVNPHFGNDEEESKVNVEGRFKGKISGISMLNDGSQSLTKQLQVTKLPEVIVITPSQTGFAVAYRGAIDNNPQVPESANMKYLENALENIQNKKNPSPSSSRPVGCNIRLLN
ncbi:redoxin domain-containing protein [Belliella sp. R4-6]|uniref:Redoxin domain-containing protein n=1 Tax=Belliella alkalica TaxID=1730871 RepID=A0ABS9VAU8_9BACT|nr:thioredoxin-like domain-containing protein [Belliella alkalica]MCH7413561.1 redoxin domain-containing protein [Belliella alkalica]